MKIVLKSTSRRPFTCNLYLNETCQIHKHKQFIKLFNKTNIYMAIKDDMWIVRYKQKRKNISTPATTAYSI